MGPSIVVRERARAVADAGGARHVASRSRMLAFGLLTSSSPLSPRRHVLPAPALAPAIDVLVLLALFLALFYEPFSVARHVPETGKSTTPHHHKVHLPRLSDNIQHVYWSHSHICIRSIRVYTSAQSLEVAEVSSQDTPHALRYRRGICC